MKPRIRFTESALKRGYDEDDIVWVMLHPLHHWLEEDREEEGHCDFFAGLLRSPSTVRIEVGAKIYPDGLVKVFHVMPLRSKFQPGIDEEQRKWGGRK